MHERLDSITRAIFLMTALCMFLAAPAAAIDAIGTDPLPLENDREYLLEAPAESHDPDGWLARDNFHFAKKSGVGYTRHLRLGERAFTIGVRGPVMPRQKALGLAFRIRF